MSKNLTAASVSSIDRDDTQEEQGKAPDTTVGDKPIRSTGQGLKLLESVVEKGKSLISIVEQVVANSKIRSSHYNDLMRFYLVDMFTLYRKSNRNSAVLEAIEQANKEFKRKTDADVARLTERVRIVGKIVHAGRRFSSIIHEMFVSSEDRTFTNTSIFKDGSLRLEEDRKTYTDRRHIRSVTITRYPEDNPDGGIIYETDPAFDVELDYNTANGEGNTFSPGTDNGVWYDVALTVTPPYGVTDEYDTEYNGILVKVTINFHRELQLNRLTIDPLSDHSLVVARVQYYDSKLGITRDVLKNREPVSGSSISYMDFEFDTVSTKRLHIYLNQPTPSPITYKIKEGTEDDETLWRRIILQTYTDVELQVNEKDGRILKETHQEMVNTDDIFTALRKKLGLMTDKRKLITVGRSRYIIGAFSIVPGYATIPYADGEYISNEYTTKKKSVFTATVEVEDEEPDGTCVNYYVVAYDANGAEIGVIPIRPTNKTEIKEVPQWEYDGTYVTMRLDFYPTVDNDDVGTTIKGRDLAIGTVYGVNVYLDDQLIQNEQDGILGNTVQVEMNEPTAGQVLSVRYTPR